jgi:hypothetical protein
MKDFLLTLITLITFVLSIITVVALLDASKRIGFADRERLSSQSFDLQEYKEGFR